MLPHFFSIQLGKPCIVFDIIGHNASTRGNCDIKDVRIFGPFQSKLLNAYCIKSFGAQGFSDLWRKVFVDQKFQAGSLLRRKGNSWRTRSSVQLLLSAISSSISWE
jgi:hypothetical protein